MTGPRETLDSWKDIAAYLKRSPRTCRNFERQMGLPVHRLDGSPKARVFAYRDEIDAWLAKKGAEGGEKRRRPLFLALGAAAVALSAFLIWRLSVAPQEAGAFDSVAILPVVNETGDAEKEHFVDGLTRMLNAELYKVAALTVPPAESILGHKNSEKTARQIARELGVDVLVQTSWLQDGTRHRLVYSVTDPFGDRCLAADALESEEENIIILQRELARAVAAAVKAAVTPAEQALLAGGPKVDPEAYALCFRAISVWQTPQEDRLDGPEFGDKALSLLRKAVEIDPVFALAYAWISEITMALAMNSFISEKDGYRQAGAAALKAIDLDESLAQAHSALGFFKLVAEWDLAAADREAALALRLEPGNHWLRYAYHENLCIFGRHEEAIEGMRLLIEMPSFGRLYLTRYGDFLTSAGRYDEAIRVYEKDPNSMNLRQMAAAHALLGDHGRAQSLYHRALDEADGAQSAELLPACLLGAAGKREEALERFEERRAYLSRNGNPPFFEAALLHASLGDKEEAFRQLDLAYENRVGRMVELVSDPWLRSLHGDPRFEELARRIGFPVIPGGKKALK